MLSLPVAVNRDLENALQTKVDRKTKPVGALGLLEKVAVQIGLIQQRLDPQITQPHMLVFAGDHGAAKAGVSAYPQDVTWQMVENYLQGGAAINVFCRQNELGLSIVDAGVAHDFGARPGLVDAKQAYGTENYLTGAAMSLAACEQAMSKGAAIVAELAANGCNLVGFGEMGIGNTAAASLITHVLTGTPLASCIGRGTGLDDAGLARKQTLLAQAMAAFESEVPAGEQTQPLHVMARFGGYEMAMMAGAMLGAAQAGMCILVDGFIVGAAALVATRHCPALRDYLVFCHRSAEPGHQAQLLALEAEPLLDLGLRLGEGTGAALAYPLVVSAVSFLNQMASFESAGVADKC